MNRADLQRLLELLNGNWGIESGMMTAISIAYLMRTSRKLKFDWRNWLFDAPPAMQLALAIATISAGTMIRGITIWIWRAFYGGADLTSVLLASLLLGGVIGAEGFLWAIIEIGTPLFGHAPWIVTLVAMTIFTAASLLFH